MNAAGHTFKNVSADLLDQACIPGIIERTLAEFVEVDILVNNAGIILAAKMLLSSQSKIGMT
ncbi:hypothetical protein O9993_01365 [Vibrio lentus]|nr:hypothetical protein [Vibrio lentus]